MSASLAPRTGAWLLGTSTWDPARVTPLLPLALMPEVVPAGTVIGALRSQRLSAAGVLTDHPVVVAGGHDHPVGAAVVHRQDPPAEALSYGEPSAAVGAVAVSFGGCLAFDRITVRCLDRDAALDYSQTILAGAATGDAVTSVKQARLGRG